jgi:hypothetical protein
MKPVYVLKDQGNMTRKVMLDIAYLTEHNKIRFFKYLYEDGLYFNYSVEKKEPGKVEKYFLTREKIKKEDDNFMYFELPAGFSIQ